MKRSPLAVAAALLLLATAAPVLARDVAGVNVPESVSVGGQNLRLNGAGIRKKFVVKVYVGALYLPAPTTNANQIIAVDQPRSVRMYFLRSVEKGKVMGAFKEGFEKNSKAQLAMLQPGLDRLGAGLRDLNKGDLMIVSYVPGEGTTVSIQGGPSVIVAGKEFADALLRNWLGPEPADDDLKKAMLAGR